MLELVVRLFAIIVCFLSLASLVFIGMLIFAEMFNLVKNEKKVAFGYLAAVVSVAAAVGCLPTIYQMFS